MVLFWRLNTEFGTPIQTLRSGQSYSSPAQHLKCISHVLVNCPEEETVPILGTTAKVNMALLGCR
jgi:hypothetical protein